jgi:hypothetical protein
MNAEETGDIPVARALHHGHQAHARAHQRGKEDLEGKEGKEDLEGKEGKEGKEDLEGKEGNEELEGKEGLEGKEDLEGLTWWLFIMFVISTQCCYFCCAYCILRKMREMRPSRGN